MNSSYLKYKGYAGRMAVDAEANIIHGDVVGIRDVVTFQGQSVEEAKQAFRDSVDDYLEFCESLGKPPEKPFSGQFLVRVKPELHRDLTTLAKARGESVNKLVARALAKVVRRARRGVERPQQAKAGPVKQPASKKVSKSTGRKSKAAS